MKRAELQALARAKRDDALLLLQNGRFSNAYYLAGYAVELALKAVISRQFSAEQIPVKAFVVDIHTHELSKLIGLAGLTAERQAKEKDDPIFAGNWALVSQWNEGLRYTSTDSYTAQITIPAIVDPNSGVFPWIEVFW